MASPSKRLTPTYARQKSPDITVIVATAASTVIFSARCALLADGRRPDRRARVIPYGVFTGSGRSGMPLGNRHQPTWRNSSKTLLLILDLLRARSYFAIEAPGHDAAAASAACAFHPTDPSFLTASSYTARPSAEGSSRRAKRLAITY